MKSRLHRTFCFPAGWRLALVIVGLLPLFAAPASVGAEVRLGIDVLRREHFVRLRGLKIGLITNHTGHDSDRHSTIELLQNAPDVELKVLFSPEHGIEGKLDEKVDSAVHAPTGLPIVSLYGRSPTRSAAMTDSEYDLAVLQTRRPPLEHLKVLDALVFDIQEGGARFFTRNAILGEAIAAAAQAGKKIFVLDRPNPLGGEKMEGPVQTRHFSFIGYHSLPVRHGLTVGELAKMLNVERKFGADVEVVKMENWERRFTFDQSGLPWTPLSPALQTLPAVVLYPGICLLEATAVSVGRGTEFPFQVVGAPYLNDVQFAQELTKAHLAGVSFVPIRFTPDPKFYVGPPEQLPFRDKNCGGVQVLLTDSVQANVVDIGIVMAQVLHRLHPQEFNVDRMAKLLGDPPTLAAIKAGKSLAEIKASWAEPLLEFARRRQPFLLYPP